MTMINLASLGITEEQLVEKIVDNTVQRLLTSVGYDEEGDEFVDDSRLVKNLNDITKKLIDAKVEQLADAHVKPLIESRLESLVLQQTSQWGEKRGTPVTFIEYLVQRADAYMVEPVDHDGKTRGESGSSYWSSKTTRVSHMIDRHLKYSIETAMQQALKDANSSITKGLADAVKIALAEVQAKLKVEVKV
jgi:hypothetical protein